MKRILPDMPRAKAHWTHRSSEIPDYIMVPMSDNKTVVRYVPEIEPPGVLKALENIRNLKDMTVGYHLTEEENRHESI